MLIRHHPGRWPHPPLHGRTPTPHGRHRASSTAPIARAGRPGGGQPVPCDLQPETHLNARTLGGSMLKHAWYLTDIDEFATESDTADPDVYDLIAQLTGLLGCDAGFSAAQTAAAL